MFILIIIIHYTIDVTSMTYSWNLFSFNERLSTVFNMMIAKKFSKDVSDLSINKIFKRNLFIANIKHTNFTKVLVNKAKIAVKDVNQIDYHPAIIAEAKDDSIIVSNLTSSEKKIEGVNPIWVGKNFKTGKDILLAKNKIFTISKKKALFVKESLNSTDINDYNVNSKSLNILANNIGNEIEFATGKELKNKNYESINMLKKTTIEKI